MFGGLLHFANNRTVQIWPAQITQDPKLPHGLVHSHCGATRVCGRAAGNFLYPHTSAYEVYEIFQQWRESIVGITWAFSGVPSPPPQHTHPSVVFSMGVKADAVASIFKFFQLNAVNVVQFV